jgi:plastocyanin
VKRPAAVLVAISAAALLAIANGAATPAQTPTLSATVGPGFTISLRDAQGSRVTTLAPGTYQIEVEDLSGEHNFHLSGPGVNESTSVEFVGKETWRVTLQDGTYRYMCDPHASTMRGSFTVGSVSQPPAPPPPPASPPPASPPPAAVTPKTRLVVTAGPAAVITLRTAAGKQVKRLKRGIYTVVVRDRSRMHNVHLVAPGFNRKTTLAFVGRQTWRVRLQRAGTLRYRCDPHASHMRGSARIVR